MLSDDAWLQINRFRTRYERFSDICTTILPPMFICGVQNPGFALAIGMAYLYTEKVIQKDPNVNFEKYSNIQKYLGYALCLGGIASGLTTGSKILYEGSKAGILVTK